MINRYSGWIQHWFALHWSEVHGIVYPSYIWRWFGPLLDWFFNGRGCIERIG